jgi:hypothetical protein
VGGDPDTLTVESTRELIGSSAYGDWIGRPSLLDDGEKWIMVYHVSVDHSGHPENRVCIRFSVDEGATWTNENKFTDGNDVTGAPFYVETQLFTGLPCIIKAPNGDLLLTIAIGREVGGSYLFRSTNGGASWTGQGLISPATDQPNDMIVIGSDIYMVTYGLGYNCLLYSSTDSGATWSKVSDVTTDADGFDTNEFSICNPSGNTLLVVLRNYDDLQTYMKISTDLGENWDTAVPIGFQAGLVHRPRLRIFADAPARIYLLGRDYLLGPDFEKTVICYSEDVGDNWLAKTELEVAYQVDCGYADMLKRTDGTIYILSYRGDFDAAKIHEYIISVTTA